MGGGATGLGIIPKKTVYFTASLNVTMISRASGYEQLNILNREVVKTLGDVGADGKKMEGFGARVGKEEEGWWRYIGSLTAYLTFPRVKFEV